MKRSWQLVACLALALSWPQPAWSQDDGLYLMGGGTNGIWRFDAAGQPDPAPNQSDADFVPNVNGDGLGNTRDLAFGPDQCLYAIGLETNAVLRYCADGCAACGGAQEGDFLGQFVTSENSGIANLEALAFGPDGKLYLMGGALNGVWRFDSNGQPDPSPGGSGAEFVSGAPNGGLGNTKDLAFGPDQCLYAIGTQTNAVLQYCAEGCAACGGAQEGDFLGQFVTAGNSGIANLEALAFGPGGKLYLIGGVLNGVWRFDAIGQPDPAPGQSGAEFVPGAPNGGLGNTTDLAFGSDQCLYAIGQETNAVLRYCAEGCAACGGAQEGDFLDQFVTDGNSGIADLEALAFHTAASGGPSDCCVANGTPGCSDPDCEALICAVDPFCCSVDWDAICADLAEAEPVCDCTEPGDCCAANDSPGCDKPYCEDLICSIDPFCCSTVWDAICAERAAVEPACACSPGGGGVSDCCIPNGTPGCTDPDCEARICGSDPFCCSVTWDSICANEALANPTCVLGCGGSGPGICSSTGSDCCIQSDCLPGNCSAPAPPNIECYDDDECQPFHPLSFCNAPPPEVCLGAACVDPVTHYEPPCKTSDDLPSNLPGASDCPSDRCGGPVKTSDPVYLFSGEYYQSEVDLRIRGRGLDFVWTRKYRSRIGPNVGIGPGWEFSYNIRILELGATPSEARDLMFTDDQTLAWSPPLVAGGDPDQLRYCTLRSTDPADFANMSTTTFIETEGDDLMSQETDTPPLGTLYSYLVSAKNGTREGPLGTDSAGAPREGLPCGASGPDLLLVDGHTRRDAYELQPDGTWTAPGFFRVFTRQEDESFTLTFPDKGVWRFHPLDRSAQQGRISSIIDRNGNALAFQYDVQGRLITITDTLDRDVTVAYDAGGFLQSVTDFAGRQVRYEYYDGIEPGGGFGDLKSVTSPSVVGTPTGNDFPNGKTTTYTYSTGNADERLNHNLLTITDPKGQLYLTNVYSTETDPTALEFDRVVRQFWGEQGTCGSNPSVGCALEQDCIDAGESGCDGDIVDYVYVRQFPSVENNQAILKTIVNDRVGNVEEYLFDYENRNVTFREYTGRWDEHQPTTEADLLAGPDTPKLHGGDPDFFETRWEYNDDSLSTTVVHSNGNKVTSVFDTINPSRRSRGNLLQRCWDPGPLGGDQSLICEAFQYDDDFGGCCGSNFVTLHQDGRFNLTLHEYDANGNRIHTQNPIPSIVEDFEYNEFGQLTAHALPDNGSDYRRRDKYTYYGSGPQRGYLHQEIVDFTGFQLTTTHEYDLVGNVVRTIDPRGHDTLYAVNNLDQVVRRISREVQITEKQSVRYRRDTFYDANDNVVRLDVRNIDDTGVLQANTDFTTVYEYEILDNPIRVCQEHGTYTGAIPGPPELPTCTGLSGTEFVTTEYEYDANRNQTLVRYGEATNGEQENNLVRTLYDERDLVLRETRAEGDPAQSTTQYDYDGNGNVVQISQGTEDVEFPRVTIIRYDGYDRVWGRDDGTADDEAMVDPMGNTTFHHYDANGNLVSSRIEGELIDQPGSNGNVRLSEAIYSFDQMDRPDREEVEFFDTATQNPIMGGRELGKVITDTEYSDNSQITRIVNDNLHDTTIVYDSVNRVRTTTDAKGNTVTFEYDENSNIISTVEVDRSDLPAEPDQSFTTTDSYDSLDRLKSTTDNVGNTSLYFHDSRDNVTGAVDALGNVTIHAYDGINRPLVTTRELTDTGDGNGALIDTIATSQTWDDTSRLTSRTDDSGNTTTYEYDALNRLVEEKYADMTVREFTLDVHDNRLTATDANLSVATNTYDRLDRLTTRLIERGAGVSDDTTMESYDYDGLSRIVEAEDDDSTVLRGYDSLSRVTTETLSDEMMVNGGITTSVYDGVGNRIECTYPGGRTVTTTYDELERHKTISDQGGLIASYDYVGPRRVQRREYGNGTRTDYGYDGITGVLNGAEDFGVKQIVATTHSVIGNGAILDARSYAWDGMYNKIRREDTRAAGPGLVHDYTYDSIYRLVRTVVTNPALTVLRDEQYDLDGVGNRNSVTGGDNPGLYTMDPALPEPGDAQMNQYTTIPPAEARNYDANGNLVGTSSPNATITYDYRNRMVGYEDTSTNVTGSYAYDALGRRIARTVDTGSGPVETRYFYDGWQVCEEQDGLGATQATYVYGRYVDEVLNMRRGAIDYYYHADDLFNVMAVTDAAGDIVERYDYGDYGDPQAMDPSGSSISQSAIDNPYLFNGRRFDLETQWYFYRTRYLDTRAGRFTSRDSLGVWGDADGVGGGYTYVANNPWTKMDPWGREAENKPTIWLCRKLKVKLDGILERMKDAEPSVREQAFREMRGYYKSDVAARAEIDSWYHLPNVPGMPGVRNEVSVSRWNLLWSELAPKYPSPPRHFIATTTEMRDYAWRFGKERYGHLTWKQRKGFQKWLHPIRRNDWIRKMTKLAHDRWLKSNKPSPKLIPQWVEDLPGFLENLGRSVALLGTPPGCTPAAVLLEWAKRTEPSPLMPLPNVKGR